MEWKQCITDKDIKALASCAEIVWNEHYSSILSQAQIDYMVERFQSYEAIKNSIEKDHYIYYMLRNDENVIAYCGFQVQKKRLFLSKLYVQKPWRGCGYASTLLTKMTNYAQKHHLEAIYLTCNRYNRGSLEFYHRKGFEIIDSADNDIGHGFVMEDYILQKAVTLDTQSTSSH